MGQSVGEVAKNWDAVCRLTENDAGIVAGLLAVDDRQDFVFFRMTDKPVRRLAVDRAEVSLAIDDSGCDQFRIRATP